MSLAYANQRVVRSAQLPPQRAPHAPTLRAPVAPRRDAAIDAVRAACLLVVVVLHLSLIHI